MGRELQKRKNRSSRATVRQPVRRKKALNPSGNQLIASNWNKKETLSQNYRRLGLVAKLGHSAGGVEPRDSPLASSSSSSSSAAQTGPVEKRTKSKIHSQSLLKQVYSEARVERDPVTGKILRIVGRDREVVKRNPLNDPLARFDLDSSDDEEMDEGGEGEGEGEWEGIDEEENDEEERPSVIRQLEREANAPREKTVRYQSEREVEWLKKLVDRYGDNVQAMARDARLNPMQQTASDLRRRLRKAGLAQ